MRIMHRYKGPTACIISMLVVFSSNKTPSWFRDTREHLSTTSLPTPKQSICSSLPDFHAIDSCPVRSPLLVADHLVELVRDKIIFEVGTRNGDILSCVSRFAKVAYSAEIQPEYCEKLRQRNLTVLCGDFTTLDFSSLSNIPDVFFWWPMAADDQNDAWLSHVRHQLSNVIPRTQERIAVIGFDHQWPRDMKNKKFMLQKYKDAEEHVIHFAEGDGPRMSGKFSLVHFKIRNTDTS